jgi:hypothetical protein
MLKTTEYYNMDSDRLLVQPLKSSIYTTEEILLMGEGKSVIFYDDIDDMMFHRDELFNVKVARLLETINERIAVIVL